MSAQRTQGSYSALRPSARLMRQHTSGGSRYIEGAIFTPYGMVFAYSDQSRFSGKGDGEGTQLRLQDGAVVHWRNYIRGYSERFLVTLAARFAKEMQP